MQHILDHACVTGRCCDAWMRAQGVLDRVGEWAGVLERVGGAACPANSVLRLGSLCHSRLGYEGAHVDFNIYMTMVGQHSGAG